MKSTHWILISLLAILAASFSTYYFLTQNSSEPIVVSPAPSGEVPPQVDATPPPPSTGAPDLSVDANGLSKSTVKITTVYGIIKYRFYSNDAPNTVKRMVALIQSGFYNSLTFHRVMPGFVAQGGDPNGNGTGGSGQRLKAEFNERRHVEGAVAMARANDPDSADSQFYITLAAQPHLDRNYTVFGQVTEGMDVVRKLQVGDKMINVVLE